jgi:hypothetical protein
MGIADVTYTNSNKGSVDLKDTKMKGDVIELGRRKFNYKLSESNIEFYMLSDKKPSMKDLDGFYPVIRNDIFKNFSSFLYNHCISTKKEIKWYLPDNKIINWFYKSLMKLRILKERNIEYLESFVNDFYKDKETSTNKIIICSSSIYKQLSLSENFKKPNSIKNNDIYYGGKLNDIPVWINTYASSQSLFLFNNYKFELVLNKNINLDVKEELGIPDSDSWVLDFKYNYQFLETSNSDFGMISLTFF